MKKKETNKTIGNKAEKSDGVIIAESVEEVAKQLRKQPIIRR
jgi:hypothetical protein